MKGPARVGLRLLGFLLFLAGIAALVLLVVPGPSDVADAVTDVLEIVFVAPILILVGGVMALTLRPEGKGPDRVHRASSR